MSGPKYYKIPIFGFAEIKRVLQLLEANGYLLNKDFRLKGLTDAEFRMIEENQNSGGCRYITYNNDGSVCKRVFELGIGRQEPDYHCEVTIEDFIKMDLINK